MFYQESKVNKHMICPICKLKYTDPRIVECSSSFCMTCIELLISNGENGFKCPVCDDFHEQPKKGYLKNPNLALLSDNEAASVSRGSLADTLAVQMYDLKLGLDELANKNRLSTETIKEYCDGLRNEVQLSSDEQIKSIKKHNMELIEQINAHETKSMLGFDQASKERFDRFIGETYEFHSKWNDYLKQFKLDDKELIGASNQAYECIEEIKKEKGQVLDKAFNGNVIQFEKNLAQLKPSVVGTIRVRIAEVRSSFWKYLKTALYA